MAAQGSPRKPTPAVPSTLAIRNLRLVARVLGKAFLLPSPALHYLPPVQRPSILRHRWIPPNRSCGPHPRNRLGSPSFKAFIDQRISVLKCPLFLAWVTGSRVLRKAMSLSLSRSALH